MNGPEVIEQEAGVEEIDSRDRPLIWSLIGGEQRFMTGLADTLVEDDVDAIAAAVRAVIAEPPSESAARSRQIDRYRERLQRLDLQQYSHTLSEQWASSSPV
jgi:malonate decarboxylase beta subunit